MLSEDEKKVNPPVVYNLKSANEKGLFERLKLFLKENKNDLFIGISFLLIALIGFGLGRLSYILQNKSALSIEQLQLGSVLTAQNISELKLVASKNGKAYYLPECPGTTRIKEENKIWFSSRKEAEELGYRPSKNCPGLE